MCCMGVHMFLETFHILPRIVMEKFVKIVCHRLCAEREGRKRRKKGGEEKEIEGEREERKERGGREEAKEKRNEKKERKKANERKAIETLKYLNRKPV